MISLCKKFLNQKVKIKLEDKRVYCGILLSVDDFLNIILDETEEYRKYKHKKGYENRKLGLCMFRGSRILHITTADNAEFATEK